MSMTFGTPAVHDLQSPRLSVLKLSQYPVHSAGSLQSVFHASFFGGCPALKAGKGRENAERLSSPAVAPFFS